MKVCSYCKEQKPPSEFSPDKRLKSGVQSRCKFCFAKIMRDRRKQNPELHRASVKKSTQKNYAAKLERNREYRRQNPEKVSRWKATDRSRHKPRILSSNAARRAKIKAYPKTAETAQIYALRDFYVAMSLGDEFHVDHIVPLSKGGSHAAENLQVIPASDNLRKGSRL